MVLLCCFTVVKASVSRAEDPRFESRLRRDFLGSSYQWLKNRHSSSYPAEAPGVIGSVLGLAGPLSVYCGWVRLKVWSANFYLSVTARKIVFADPSLIYSHVAGTLSNQQTTTVASQPSNMQSVTQEPILLSKGLVWISAGDKFLTQDYLINPRSVSASQYLVQAETKQLNPK